jgi:hypothetical protein
MRVITGDYIKAGSLPLLLKLPLAVLAYNGFSMTDSTESINQYLYYTMLDGRVVCGFLDPTPALDTLLFTMPSNDTMSLAQTSLWQRRTEALTFEERVKISYKRCRSVLEHYELEISDILNISPKYWRLQ